MDNDLRNRRVNVVPAEFSQDQDFFQKFNLLIDFQDHCKIGSGAFGLVIKAKKIDENVATALKLIPFCNKPPAQEALAEAHRISGLPSHPSVIQCLDFFVGYINPHEHKIFLDLVKPGRDSVFSTFPTNAMKLDFLCIRMPLCDGNLRKWLQREELEFLESTKLFVQIMSGIDHIHRQGLIHRDIKPENILFSGRSAKITDFGISAAHSSSDYNHTGGAGTLYYMAPEQRYSEYGKSVDLYSMGLILLELFYPRAQKNHGETLTAARYGRFPAEFSTAYPDVKKLVENLVDFNPKNRPNYSQVLGKIAQWPQFAGLGSGSNSTLEDHLRNLTLGSQNYDGRYKCPSCDFLCEGSSASHGVLRNKVPGPNPKMGRLHQNESTNGCRHYERRCKIQCPAPDCRRFFSCRICHDEIIKGHKIDRKAVVTIQCNHCKRMQMPSNYCNKCGITFAKYYCSICHLYDDSEQAEQLIYHCTQCGFCRRKKDKWTEYIHCGKCNMCITLFEMDSATGVRRYSAHHQCKYNGGKSPCPVCRNDMHESRECAVQVDCQHYVHQSCKLEFPAGLTKCPECAVW